MNQFFNSRRFRHGSVATAVTVIVIAIIIVFNLLVSALANRYTMSFDLTKNQIFGLSKETENFLADLNKDIDIYVLNTEDGFIASGGEYYRDYFTQAIEVINQYAKRSPRVNVQYVDLVRYPTFTSRYPNLQLNSSSIVVACGDKSTDLTPYTLYDVETDSNGYEWIVASKAEQAMTSAILKVTSDKITRVSILTGHNETPLDGLTALLELNSFEIVEQNLLTEQIDSEATAAIMCAPMRDLSEDELKKLDAFLDNDGKLGKSFYYFASDSQPDLPNLAAFLADWGIEVGNGVVFEAAFNQILRMNRLIPIVDYTEGLYAQTALDHQLYTVIPYARPLSVLFSSKSRISVTAPLQFSSTSGILPPGADETWQPGREDITGPIPALIVAQNTSYEGFEALRSNVVACGSALAVESGALSDKSIGNGEYFLNLISILSEREETVNIQSKTIGGNELGIQTEQILILGILFAILLPLAVLISGTVIWLRRRHR